MLYMVPDSMGWRYTMQTVTFWINSFKQCPTNARIDGVGMRKDGRDSPGRSLMLLWTLSAKTELVFVSVPGAPTKVRFLH